MKVSRPQKLVLVVISLYLSKCNVYGQKPQSEPRKITFTTVQKRDVTLTQQYVCRINSHRNIQVQSLTKGRIAATSVKEGQAVKRGDLLFSVEPPRDKEKPDAEKKDKGVFIKAPFDGLIGKLLHQEGSFVQKGDKLTTLSDNSVMWVYFNVPEARYLEYMAEQGQNRESPDVELLLADHSKFPHAGKIGAIGSDFNKQTGNIAFRADFSNPTGLLRHGQSGTVVIHRVLNDAVVIPQRATFGILDKHYVYAVDKDAVAHRREIVIRDDVEDVFVVKKGIEAGEKIVVDGVKLVRDGDKVE